MEDLVHAPRKVAEGLYLEMTHGRGCITCRPWNSWHCRFRLVDVHGWASSTSWHEATHVRLSSPFHGLAQNKLTAWAANVMSAVSNNVVWAFGMPRHQHPRECSPACCTAAWGPPVLCRLLAGSWLITEPHIDTSSELFSLTPLSCLNLHTWAGHLATNLREEECQM